MNMLHHLSTNSARLASRLIDSEEMLAKKVNPTHYGGGHTSHTQQNN